MPKTFHAIPFWIIIGYYLIINMVLFAAMALDKSRAVKNRRRIPEKTLFFMAILGGGIGGLLAMYTKRHKTRHIDFIIAFAFTTLLHMFVCYMVMKHFIWIG